MNLKTILVPWPWIFAFLALSCHLLIQWNFLGLPLIGDEGYYANPLVLESLLKWPEYSFGHPPGWHYIHAVFYLFLDVKSETIRILGLSFSTTFLIFLFFLGWFRKQLLLASVFMVIIACHEYVRDFGSFNHSVIATALFGFASLFLADAKKWVAFSMTLTLALMIRESALVFAVASLFFMDSKRSWKYLAVPVGLFGLCYLWFFISKQGLLVNDQVRILLDSGQAPFTMSLEKLGNHVHFILQLFPASFFLLALAGLPAVYASKKFHWTPLTSALLTVFSLHTLFFGLYVDQGHRNTFLAAMALGFLVFHWMETESEKPWVKPAALLLAGVLTSFQLINWTQQPTDRFLRQQDDARVHRAMAGLLDPLVRNNENLVIMTTNPYHEYLMFPWQGYTDTAMEADWYGGAPGYMQVRDFDVGIVHLPLDWWPEQDIFEYTQDNNFELYHEIKGSSTTVQIWVRPGIKP